MYTCNVCKKRQKPYFKYKKFRYYKCPNCALVSTYPIPTMHAMKGHYLTKFNEGNYNLLLAYENEYKRVYNDFIKILSNIVKRYKLSPKKLSVLDVGCFTGVFLEMLKKIGYQVSGLELQKEAVEIAQRKLPNKVFQADILKTKLSKKYDIVTLLGLVEHVTDPNLLISKCEKVLNPNGIVFIQTPESSSIPAKLLKQYWPPYAPIEHVHLFSRKSLVMLLENHGFEIIHSSSHIKKLPISYVYQMLGNFGPEFKKILSPLYFVLPKGVQNSVLPFYVGEMIIVGRKLPKD